MKVFIALIVFSAALCIPASAQCSAGGGFPEGQGFAEEPQNILEDGDMIDDMADADWSQIPEIDIQQAFKDGLAIQSSEEDESLANKTSLTEIMDATMAKGFDDIFQGEKDKKTASAMDVLKYLLFSTKVEPKYLTALFYKAAKVKSDKELEESILSEDKMLDVINRIVGHFQDAPDDAGRPASESEEKKEGEEGDKPDTTEAEKEEL